MTIQDAIRNHPAVGGLVGGAVLGAGSAGIVNLIVGGVRKAKTTRKKKTTKKRSSSTTKKRKSKPRTRTSTRKSPSKKIYTTKNGQPYIKLASGKARFISKKSARIRKKRKGGYY